MNLTTVSSRNIFALTKLRRRNILFPIRSIMDAIKRPEDVASVDVHAAKVLLGSGYRYLDVRTNEEFNKSHVDNALNVPYMFITQEGRVKNPEFLTQVASVCKKEDHLVVGYEHVTNMEGGYSAWVDKRLAGDKPAEELKTYCKFRP